MRAEGFSVTSYQLPVTSENPQEKLVTLRQAQCAADHCSHFDRLSASLVTENPSSLNYALKRGLIGKLIKIKTQKNGKNKNNRNDN
jgi:hypothetical protein